MPNMGSVVSTTTEELSVIDGSFPLHWSSWTPYVCWYTGVLMFAVLSHVTREHRRAEEPLYNTVILEISL